MKTNFTFLGKIFFLFSFFFALTATAQAPEKMSYQAVIRNAGNALVTNQSIGMRISILQTTATGTAVYVETQTTTTNANGLASIEIGGGTVVSGTFANINWAADKYFIKTETDPTGGTAYSITGTSQLLSAPYALFAKKSGGNVYPNVEVSDKVTTSQTFAQTGNTPIAPYSTIIAFSGTNNANATLTGGNTWDGSKFTAGTAGWYQVHIQMYAVNSANTLPSQVGIRYLLDKNAALGTATRIGAYAYSQYDTDPNGSNNNTPKSAAGNLDCFIYLAANDYIEFRGWSMAATSTQAYSSTDGSSNITIVRIK